MPYFLQALKSFILSDADIADMRPLLSQLDPQAPKLTKDRIKQVMEHGRVVIIRHHPLDGNAHIVAMATLVFKEQLMGRFGLIEDVVVDEKHRQKGLGRWLTQALIARAEIFGMTHLDLTSRPHRTAANNMYEKMGFLRRDTNVYRFVLKNKRP
ncbi:MAG: GNAT family N-acetyltransferase [Candidatus Niyogibacteria bacterium]|nr:GNAT family N-acetyltransferase [Candidatus Niyogibacteria bacterium]